MELATKVLTLVLAAMDAADADLHSALRLRFIKMLLAKGEALCLRSQRILICNFLQQSESFFSSTFCLPKLSCCSTPVLIRLIPTLSKPQQKHHVLTPLLPCTADCHMLCMAMCVPYQSCIKGTIASGRLVGRGCGGKQSAGGSHDGAGRLHPGAFPGGHGQRAGGRQDPTPQGPSAGTAARPTPSASKSAPLVFGRSAVRWRPRGVDGCPYPVERKLRRRITTCTLLCCLVLDAEAIDGKHSWSIHSRMLSPLVLAALWRCIHW